MGATQWGNAGRILQGYENVRGIGQRIDGGVGRIAAICLSESVRSFRVSSRMNSRLLRCKIASRFFDSNCSAVEKLRKPQFS